MSTTKSILDDKQEHIPEDLPKQQLLDPESNLHKGAASTSVNTKGIDNPETQNQKDSLFIMKLRTQSNPVQREHDSQMNSMSLNQANKSEGIVFRRNEESSRKISIFDTFKGYSQIAAEQEEQKIMDIFSSLDKVRWPEDINEDHGSLLQSNIAGVCLYYLSRQS